jgi:hypothetical protein
MPKTNLGCVDRLGILKAQIAELKREEELIKAALIAEGVGAYEGDFYRATVSQGERATLDMAAVRAHLSPQFIRAHTNVSQVTIVKVVARNNAKLVA